MIDYLSINSFTGLAILPSKLVSVGAYFHSKLELPPFVKLGEHVSVKLTCINYGSQTIFRTFEFISTGQFNFLSHDGIEMVSIKDYFVLVRARCTHYKVPDS